MKTFLRVILIVAIQVLACLNLSMLAPSVHAMTVKPAIAIHHIHAVMPLTTCLAAPSDANCDNQWPDQSGDCWDYGNSYIVHSSGWVDHYGHTMQINLWRSRTCRTTWSENLCNSCSGGATDMEAGVYVTPDNKDFLSSFLTQNYIWSKMGYTGAGECSEGEAYDGYTWHYTPTYCF